MIYTIGHSNHPAEAFLALLRQHAIEVVVDVRSSPYSRRVPQANRETLASTLKAAGIGYEWLGEHLGGKVADYDRQRASPGFLEAIANLVALAKRQRTAIMCAEGDHRRCHRQALIAPALLDRRIRVLHIQPDGTLVDEAEEVNQLTLL